MTPERWAEVNDVFHRAMELASEQRYGYLDQACAADTSLRREVESLLGSHEQDKAFLEQPVAMDAADLAGRPDRG